MITYEDKDSLDEINNFIAEEKLRETTFELINIETIMKKKFVSCSIEHIIETEREIYRIWYKTF